MIHLTGPEVRATAALLTDLAVRGASEIGLRRGLVDNRMEITAKVGGRETRYRVTGTGAREHIEERAAETRWREIQI